MTAVDAIRRKLDAFRAVLQDSAVTEHERANALALKRNLEKKLQEEGVPKGDWTDIAFRTGQAIHNLKNATAPPASINKPSSKAAFRLGKALGTGLRKWRSS